MRKPLTQLLRNSRAVSYTISAVIMTATTLALVLVASGYTYQILEQQRGATEFDAAKKSILAFDDALTDASWKPQASRSARFTVNYGQLELIPDMPLKVNVTDYANASYDGSTAYIRYRTKTTYISFADGYQSYFLGNDTILSSGAGSYGRAAIEQNSGWVDMVLTYGVRAMKTSTVNMTQGDQTLRINNVDIWIITIYLTNWPTYIGDFDLKAKCLDVTTESFADVDNNGYPVDGDNQCTINVQLGNNPVDTASIELDGDKVVFNFVIATVRVSW